MRFPTPGRSVVPLLVLLAVGFGSGGRSGAAQTSSGQLTVEAIFGASRIHPAVLDAVEWSADGKRLSYFQPSTGGTELWALDVATGQRQRLVSGAILGSVVQPWPPTWLQRTGFGRRPPKRYLWSPGGDGLLFRSASELDWLDLKTSRIRKLVTGDKPLTDPKISPDGRWVSFVRDYNLWVADVQTGRERALTTGGSEEMREGQLDWIYPEELGLFTAYWWSPDSSRIAYLEFDERHVLRYPLLTPNSYDSSVYWTRYPRAGEPNPAVRVGVVDVAGGKTAWMDAGGDKNVYLARVAWIPGGKELAIERLNRAQTRLDLLFADAASGHSRTVLGEEDRYWINLGDELYFFRDRRFLWSSERTGFRHLYLYDASGHLIRPLTSGEWVVTSLAGVDEAAGLVYFVATKDSPLERQLYRVRLDGSGLERITGQAGTHNIDMAPAAGAFLDTYSNASTPPRQDVYAAGGKLIATLSAGAIPALAGYRLGPEEFLKLRAADGTELEAEMIKPPDFTPTRKYPVLVAVYSGPEVQIVLNQWGGSPFLWHELMAEHGYIVFALDNRGTYNRGHAFETPVYRHLGSVELTDQLAGIHYLESLPYVDSSRIGVWGWSYGGHMTLQLLFRDGDVFKAGVAVAPVTDWRQYDSIYTERYMGTPQENPDGYRASSPVSYAGQLKGQLLLIHGTGDDNVHFANTTELIEQLIAHNLYAHHVQLMIFPGRGHPIGDPPAQVQLFDRATEFLLKNL
ncbi:MAG TPA: S9 family peptidase [Candidatus Acidoferrales bacterium]|nr:S9 family peptidase [Candidatus Acidoferrales bacterium]